MGQRRLDRIADAALDTSWSHQVPDRDDTTCSHAMLTLCQARWTSNGHWRHGALMSACKRPLRHPRHYAADHCRRASIGEDETGRSSVRVTTTYSLWSSITVTDRERTHHGCLQAWRSLIRDEQSSAIEMRGVLNRN